MRLARLIDYYFDNKDSNYWPLGHEARDAVGGRPTTGTQRVNDEELEKLMEELKAAYAIGRCVGYAIGFCVGLLVRPKVVDGGSQ
jgi:hypothetical protein